MVRLLPVLSRFTGLRELGLFADSWTDDEPPDWSEPGAVLRPPLLRHLPRQLESLEFAFFSEAHLKAREGAASSAAVAAASENQAEAAGVGGLLPPMAGNGVPAELFPNLEHLQTYCCDTVTLDASLPSLQQLEITKGSHVSIEGAQLHLPQLTSLVLDDVRTDVLLHCASVPALAHLNLAHACLARPDDSQPGAGSGYAALRRLTQLELHLDFERPGDSLALLAGVAPTLRSFRLWGGHEFDQQVADALEDASQLTHLVSNPSAANCGSKTCAWLHVAWAARALEPLPACNLCVSPCLAPPVVLPSSCLCQSDPQDVHGSACLANLPAWPNLQELSLLHVRPTSITAEQLALLSAAPSLRRFVLAHYGCTKEVAREAAWQMEAERIVVSGEDCGPMPVVGCVCEQSSAWPLPVSLLCIMPPMLAASGMLEISLPYLQELQQALPRCIVHKA